MDNFDTVLEFLDPVEEGYNMDTAKLIKDPRVYEMRKMTKVCSQSIQTWSIQ